MKPVLVVEGEKREIVVVGVVTEGSDVTQYFYDADARSYMDENQKANLSQAIENPNQTARFIENLQKTIDETKDYVLELKMKIVDSVIENIELPFPDILLKPIVDEIKECTSYIEGLEMALDIATGKNKVSEPFKNIEDAFNNLVNSI